jgi:hypothetical protein
VLFGNVANALDRQMLTSGVQHVPTAITRNATLVPKSEATDGLSVSEFIDISQAPAAFIITARLWIVLGLRDPWRLKISHEA